MRGERWDEAAAMFRKADAIGQALISRMVVCRDQPPSLILMWLSQKDQRKVRSVPLSVTGGLSLSGL
jgi:hypothetical protein